MYVCISICLFMQLSCSPAKQNSVRLSNATCLLPLFLPFQDSVSNAQDSSSCSPMWLSENGIAVKLYGI